MGDEYQLRKDIDRLMRDVYSNNELIAVTFSNEEGGLKSKGNLDEIFEYYSLTRIYDYLIEHINSLQWTSVSLANGTLYINEGIRLCELIMSISYEFQSTDWETVDSITLTDYPPLSDGYAMGDGDIIVCLTTDGEILAKAPSSGEDNVNFRIMWHY